MIKQEKLSQQLQELKEETVHLHHELRERGIGYIITALGLVAGLAWNETIKSLIEYLFPLHKDSLLAKFIYAILITLMVVILTTYLVRLMKKQEKHDQENIKH